LTCDLPDLNGTVGTSDCDQSSIVIWSHASDVREFLVEDNVAAKPRHHPETSNSILNHSDAQVARRGARNFSRPTSGFTGKNQDSLEFIRFQRSYSQLIGLRPIPTNLKWAVLTVKESRSQPVMVMKVVLPALTGQ
jgi:hypothetical protein